MWGSHSIDDFGGSVLVDVARHSRSPKLGPLCLGRRSCPGDPDEPFDFLRRGSGVEPDYYDFFVICVALLVPLRELVKQKNDLIAEGCQSDYASEYRETFHLSLPVAF